MGEYTTLEKLKIRLGQYHTETVTDEITDIASEKVVFDKTEENILQQLLIDTARLDIRNKRNYPDTWEDNKIQVDLQMLETSVIELSLYDYNMQGGEYHKSYGENGTSRSFMTRDEILVKVIPFATVF